MKKYLLFATVFISSFVYARIPNEKILKIFNATFPKAENVSWSDNKDEYQVQFMNSTVRCKMWYDADGNILKTMRYYTEENLSPFIMAKLKEKYAGKTVFGVTEVSSEQGLIYYIILQDDKKWYNVTSDASGNITLENKYNKA